MFQSEWLHQFPSAPCLAGGDLMTARVSVLLKSRTSLTCFRAGFLPIRTKELSAPSVNFEPFLIGNKNIWVTFCPLTGIAKWSRYRFGVAQRVGRGIALLFHDCSTWRGWVVSSTPWPHFTLGKDSVPILQEAGWVPGAVWTGGKPRLQVTGIVPQKLCTARSKHNHPYLIACLT